MDTPVISARSEPKVSPRRLAPTEIPLFDEWLASIFDNSSLGLIRLNLDLTIDFANPRALEICGRDSLDGVSILSLLPDEENATVMKEQFSTRQQGISTEYDLEFLNSREKRRVPVKIVGMPVVAIDGTIAGSIGIVRSLEVEKQSEAFEEAIQNAKGAMPILQAACDRLRALLPFEFCSINVYSEDLQYARQLFTYDPNQHVQMHSRWYPVSDSLVEWVRTRKIQVCSLDEFLDHFPELKSDPNVVAFIEKGFKRFLRYPIVLGGRVIASLTCCSKDPTAFDEKRLEFARLLPIGKALLVALHYLETDDLRFRFALVKDLFACRSPRSIAKLVTEQLADHCGWQRTEIHWVDEAKGKFRLLSQHVKCADLQRPESFEQDIHEGALARAYQTGEDINVQDAARDGENGSASHAPKTTASQLCMPIRVDGEIRAILNIEEPIHNAFSHDEVKALRSLLDEISSLLSAVRIEGLLAQTFVSTPSAVFVTDGIGRIIKANSASLGMLGYTEEELAKTQIRDYFVSSADGHEVLKNESPELETALKSKSGRTVPVLVGAHELHGFNAWVVSAKDLTFRRRVEELEMLGQLYREIAVQTKTPLSLASSWLSRIKRKESTDPGIVDTLDRTLAQLKKVDITFERLALYDQQGGMAPYNEILLDLAPLLKRVLGELPKSELEHLVQKGVEEHGLYVRGDAFQITFMIETTLSYLFRFRPEDENVYLDVIREAERLKMILTGPAPSPNGFADSAEIPPEVVCQTRYEMALGEKIIERFMQNHQGHFRKCAVQAGTARFEFDFPAARIAI